MQEKCRPGDLGGPEQNPPEFWRPAPGLHPPSLAMLSDAVNDREGEQEDKKPRAPSSSPWDTRTCCVVPPIIIRSQSPES